jgi:hypothetical protein
MRREPVSTRGDTTNAIGYYNEFFELWKDAECSLR